MLATLSTETASIAFCGIRLQPDFLNAEGERDSSLSRASISIDAVVVDERT